MRCDRWTAGVHRDRPPRPSTLSRNRQRSWFWMGQDRRHGGLRHCSSTGFGAGCLEPSGDSPQRSSSRFKMGQRRAPLLASPSGHVVDAAAGCFGLGKGRIVVHPDLTQFTLSPEFNQRRPASPFPRSLRGRGAFLIPRSAWVSRADSPERGGSRSRAGSAAAPRSLSLRR